MKLTWRDMIRVINHKTEEELREMIVQEFETFKRPTILIRLHQKFTMVRAQREREELIGVRDDRPIM